MKAKLLSASQARVEPVNPEDMNEQLIDILKGLPGKGLKGQYAPKNVLGTLMHNEGNIGAFLNYWVTSKREAKISPRMQELVILRVALHYNSDYVWGHHIPPALEAGITREEIHQVTRLEDLSNFCAKESILLQAADEIAFRRFIRDVTYEKMTQFYDIHEILDFIHLVTQYNLFSLVNNTFCVELEKGIESIPDKPVALDVAS